MGSYIEYIHTHALLIGNLGIGKRIVVCKCTLDGEQIVVKEGLSSLQVWVVGSEHIMREKVAIWVTICLFFITHT